MPRRSLTLALFVAAVVAAACHPDSTAGPRLRSGQGLLSVRLQDGPLTLDSIAHVYVYVERIDARRLVTDSAHVDDDLDRHEDADHDEGMAHDSTMWVTIAKPDTTFDLLTLRNGVTAFLGSTPIDTGHFKSVRLIINPAKSSIVLKNGKVLTTTSTPPVEFENRGRHGIAVELEDELDITEGATTTLTLDLKLDKSLSLRGSGFHDGIFFRPVVNGKSHHD